MSEAARLGRYVLKRKIATGGMAEIWLAQQEGPAGFEKEIVVKRILPHLADDEKFVSMFLDEARLAARLTHPNIAQIFDLGEADGFYYIAMEYIDGWDLEAILHQAVARGHRIPAELAARIIADACIGLAYAHSLRDRDGTPVGLVHRDISPQNLLVSRDGVVKLVDFGVAKARSSANKTQTGAVKGKLSYMSPEQIQGRPLDGRSDIFALGIVLYEMLTTQRPFGHDSELLAVSAILNEAPRPIHEIAGTVHPDLERIVYRALEKRVEDRFEHASDLQLALESWLSRIGAVLTQRDVSSYLHELFDSNAPGPLASVERIRSRVDLAAQTAAVPAAVATAVQGMVPNGASTSHFPPTGIPRGAPQAAASPAPAARARGGASQPDASELPDPHGDRGVQSSAGLLLGVAGALVVLLGIAGFFLYRAMTNDPTPPEVIAATPDAPGTALAETNDAGVTAPDTTTTLVANATGADASVHAAIPPTGDGPDATPTGMPTAGSGEDAAALLPEPTDAGPAPESDTGMAIVAPDAGPPSDEDVAQADDTSPATDDAGPDDAEPANTGLVRITVLTGGRQTVYADGRKIGTLPNRAGFPLEPGTVKLRIVDERTGRSKEESVAVQKGAVKQLRIRF